MLEGQAELQWNGGVACILVLEGISCFAGILYCVQRVAGLNISPAIGSCAFGVTVLIQSEPAKAKAWRQQASLIGLDVVAKL